MSRRGVFISDADKQTIKDMYATGSFTKKKLAEDFGITVKRISNIVGYKRALPVNLVEDFQKINVAKLETKAKLIEAMADYALECNWEDQILIEKLFGCGLTESDFESCGYGAFIKDHFSVEEENCI